MIEGSNFLKLVAVLVLKADNMGSERNQGAAREHQEYEDVKEGVVRHPSGVSATGKPMM